MSFEDVPGIIKDEICNVRHMPIQDKAEQAMLRELVAKETPELGKTRVMIAIDKRTSCRDG